MGMYTTEARANGVRFPAEPYMKKRHYLALVTVAIIIFLLAFLYHSTGFFQSARLMIHSYVASPAELTDLAARVNTHFNDTVYVPILSGHGEVPSHLIGKDLYTWYSEMEKEFTKLNESCSKINVLGSSFGGALALRLAENEEFSNLYLVNAFVDKSSSWYKVVPFETRLHFASPLLYYSRKSKVAQINDPEGLAKHIAYWTMPYQPVLSSLPFLAAVRVDASRISIPTLAIHSKNDRVADFERLKEVFDKIDSEDKEFMNLSRSNHVLLFDYDREEVINRIISFEESRR